MAYAASKGKIPVSRLRGSALRMYQNMNEDQLNDFASTNTKNLPTRKKGFKVLHRN